MLVLVSYTGVAPSTYAGLAGKGGALSPQASKAYGSMDALPNRSMAAELKKPGVAYEGIAAR